MCIFERARRRRPQRLKRKRSPLRHRQKDWRTLPNAPSRGDGRGPPDHGVKWTTAHMAAEMERLWRRRPAALIRTFDHKAPVWVQCRVKMSRDHQEHVCSTGHKAFVDTSVRWHRHECNCVRSARRRRPGKTRAAKAVRSRGVAWLSSTQSQGGQTLMAGCGSGGSKQVLHTLYVWPLGLVGACAQPNCLCHLSQSVRSWAG